MAALRPKGPISAILKTGRARYAQHQPCFCRTSQKQSAVLVVAYWWQFQAKDDRKSPKPIKMERKISKGQLMIKLYKNKVL